MDGHEFIDIYKDLSQMIVFWAVMADTVDVSNEHY